MKLTKEELDARLAQIEDMERVLDKLKNEVKAHNILAKIERDFANAEMEVDVVQFDNGKRYVLANMGTQLEYNGVTYRYVNIYGYPLKKDNTKSVRCVNLYSGFRAKVIGKLEDLQNG